MALIMKKAYLILISVLIATAATAQDARQADRLYSYDDSSFEKVSTTVDGSDINTINNAPQYFTSASLTPYSIGSNLVIIPRWNDMFVQFSTGIMRDPNSLNLNAAQINTFSGIVGYNHLFMARKVGESMSFKAYGRLGGGMSLGLINSGFNQFNNVLLSPGFVGTATSGLALGVVNKIQLFAETGYDAMYFTHAINQGRHGLAMNFGIRFGYAAF